jgi:hypothetical protein
MSDIPFPFLWLRSALRLLSTYRYCRIAPAQQLVVGAAFLIVRGAVVSNLPLLCCSLGGDRSCPYAYIYREMPQYLQRIQISIGSPVPYLLTQILCQSLAINY